MIKIKVKKQYKGTIDIRSTYIAKALEKEEDIEVSCTVLDGKSIYTHKELTSPIKIAGPFTSKIEGRDQRYTLYVFKWKGNS